MLMKLTPEHEQFVASRSAILQHAKRYTVLNYAPKAIFLKFVHGLGSLVLFRQKYINKNRDRKRYMRIVESERFTSFPRQIDRQTDIPRQDKRQQKIEERKRDCILNPFNLCFKLQWCFISTTNYLKVQKKSSI